MKKNYFFNEQNDDASVVILYLNECGSGPALTSMSLWPATMLHSRVHRVIILIG